MSLLIPTYCQICLEDLKDLGSGRSYLCPRCQELPDLVKKAALRISIASRQFNERTESRKPELPEMD